MEIPKIAEFGPAPDGTDETLAQQRGFELAAQALASPTEIRALLHGAALLIAWLAATQEKPGAGAGVLLDELSRNAMTCLRRLRSIQAGTA